MREREIERERERVRERERESVSEGEREHAAPQRNPRSFSDSSSKTNNAPQPP